jgi:rhodanese-related sulfurtransferase
MYLIAAGAVIVLLAGWFVLRGVVKHRTVERHMVSAEELKRLLESKQVRLFDVRQPLDFLAHPEIIPGATRIPPKEIPEVTESYPRDIRAVIYCTGADDDTATMVLGKAQALNFTNIKILKGGLAAWKAKGWPVEPYQEAFTLDTAK